MIEMNVATALFPPTGTGNSTATTARTHAGRKGAPASGSNPGPPLPLPHSPLFSASLPAHENSPPSHSSPLSLGDNATTAHGLAASLSAAPRGAHDAGYSAAAGSLNAYLDDAYAGGRGMLSGGGERGGCGSASVRASSVLLDGAAGGGGGGGRSCYGGDAPLRQLIEAKERELHEIHDFRIR